MPNRPEPDPSSPAFQVAHRIISLKHPDESDAAFARRAALSPPVIRHYRSGRRGASVDALHSVVTRLGVNAHWLLTGQGSPYEPSSVPLDPATAPPEAIIAHIRRLVGPFNTAEWAKETLPEDALRL